MTTNTRQIKQESTPRFKWWYCVIIYVIANGIGFLPAGFNGNEAFYNNFQQPALAPPDWMFAPAWFINNVTSLVALYIVVNKPVDTPGRKKVISLEVATWILYAVFTSLYFGLKSPVLGAIDTAAGFMLSVMSLVITPRISKKAAWLLVPRVAWLALATYVSIWIAINNKDVFLDSLTWG